MDVSAVTAAAVGPGGELLDHVLRVLGAGAGEREVLARTATLVAALTAADVVVVWEDGHVHGGAGLARGAVPGRGLARVVREGHGSFAVPGLGRMHAHVVEVPGLPGVHVVTGRRTEDVDPDALRVVALVARCAGLVVLARHGAERERRSRLDGARGAAGRVRWETALHTREEVLTASERFRRSLTGRLPRPELLVRVAETASALLGGRAVSLVLTDPRPGAAPRVAAAAGHPPLEAVRALRAADELAGSALALGGAGVPAAAALPVEASDVGALVVDTGGHGPLDAVPAALLVAFAEHAGAALALAGAAGLAGGAEHDPLTGLPTRRALLHHLALALGPGDGIGSGDGTGSGTAVGPGAAVVVVELAGLTTGPGTVHAEDRDEVLRRVGRRLRRCLGADDVAAHLGGDQFALLVRDADPSRAAARVAARVREDVGAPVELDDTLVRFGTTIGVAVAQEGVEAEELLRHADSARCDAAAPADADALRRRLESDLERALAAGEFELAYRPLVRLADGAVVGVEALPRWRHRVRGLIDPGALLAGVDRSPAVDDLRRWVLGEACSQVARWRRTTPGLSLTVALAGRHVLSRTAADDVRRALADAGLPPGALALGVPSTLLEDVHDRAVVTTRLQALRSTGARVLLDDFATRAGTGDVLAAHALAPLRRLPVDGFTLDRALVGELDGPRRSAAVATVGTLCDLAAALDLTVVARGVDRVEQVVLLQELGCPLAGGALLGAPRPAADHAAGLAALVGAVEVPAEALAVGTRPVAVAAAEPRSPEPRASEPRASEPRPLEARPPEGRPQEPRSRTTGLGALTRPSTGAPRVRPAGPVALAPPPVAEPVVPAVPDGEPVPVPLRVRPRDVRRLLDQSR